MLPASPRSGTPSVWQIVGPWRRPLYKSSMSERDLGENNVANTTFEVNRYVQGLVATEDE